MGHFFNLRSFFSFRDCRRDYVHLTVKHSKGFKDPIMAAHTNTVEGMWAHAKHSIPSARRKKLFAGYMGSYMLQRKLGGERKSNSFLSFIKIANHY